MPHRLTRRHVIALAAAVTGTGVLEAAQSVPGAAARPAAHPAAPHAHHLLVPATVVDRHIPAHVKHARHGHHVHLPAPSIPVQHRPAYYVDDLIAHPPAHTLALTIDDGPDPEWTPKVLRLLDQHRMHASFSVVGVHAVAFPKLVRDIARAGHTLVNHSFTHHEPFTDLPHKRIVWEITRTQRAISKAAGVTPQLFRSPGGDWSPFLFRALAAYDLWPVDWDVDPQDWAEPGTRQIVHAMLQAKPRDIVICHDGGGDRHETVRALRRVLPEWRHRGLRSIRLSAPHATSA
jgi:peptidoglycan/xylan/chitin deacetylase (PgdA/CDA1 family)